MTRRESRQIRTHGALAAACFVVATFTDMWAANFGLGWFGMCVLMDAFLILTAPDTTN